MVHLPIQARCVNPVTTGAAAEGQKRTFASFAGELEFTTIFLNPSDQCIDFQEKPCRGG
jgi:hypothetical protein